MNQPPKDYLWEHIRILPYFRGFLRAIEARFYQDISLTSPTLDLGCGDGHFASVAFNQTIEVGLDPWISPLKEAATWGAYQMLVQSDGAQMPFPNAIFGSAVSNSVLEHIPHLDLVLVETGRVMQSGATFAFCVPNHLFTPSLSIAYQLDKIRMPGLASGYRSFFNKIARHHHCDSPETWEFRLKKAGFEILQWWHYFSPAMLRVMEWGHYIGLPYLISRKLTGKWIPFNNQQLLKAIYAYLKPYYDQDPRCEDGVCTFYITRRV